MLKVDISANCPCCEFKTFDKNSRGNYEICPVCFWEDDLTQEVDQNWRRYAVQCIKQQYSQHDYIP